MNLRLPECAFLCFLLAFVVTAGCSDSSPTAPATPAAAAKITAEPNAIVPEFVPGAACHGRFRPFDGRLVLVFHSQRDFFLRELRFEFADVFGGRAAPRVSSAASPFPSASVGSPVPTVMPIPSSPTIPFPSSPAVPFPTPSSGAFEPLAGLTRTAVRFDPLVVPAGTHTLPLFLQFGCGVPASGILFIDIEIREGEGAGLEARRLEVGVKG